MKLEVGRCYITASGIEVYTLRESNLGGGIIIGKVEGVGLVLYEPNGSTAFDSDSEYNIVRAAD